MQSAEEEIERCPYFPPFSSVLFVVNILNHAEFWRYLFMKWEEARTYYPAQWLLVEAIEAHSEANKRILDEIAVVNVFNNSQEAM